LEIATVGKEKAHHLAALVLRKPSYDPGRFEVMFEVTRKVSDLITAACS
jgi:hypothetical protein